MNRQKGITLIEVLVTLLVTTVGLLGLAALQLNALQATADSGQRSQAVWLMQDLIERMRVNPRASDGQYLQAVTCTTTPQQCAPTPNETNSVACSAEQMAYFDLWETQCRYSSNNNEIYNSRDALLPAGSQPGIISLAQETNSDVFRATATWFYKGGSSHTSSGINTPQEIRR
ncbi:type IV pilus modification protein PilV [Thiopseudomonas denitrificans]|uniref:Type IV pilus assembly protein PilV n=1 Tax=Thiopseudomonas denitrificans TaxID=1501432 RepID=A0A4R6TZN9_9GAMM|nr:type IV pilus modification protein PilV [Thiopseudomonas denitrificans]TDQ39478.1 type IV pilus assembly protein PilV [Thiopseudomonas denitrificans]